MAEISETYPEFTVRRDSFKDEETYEEFRQLVRSLDIFREAVSDAVADLEARMVVEEAELSPISVPCAAFIPEINTYDFTGYLGGSLRNFTSLTAQYFYAPVYFPDGVTVTKMTCYGYRDDTLATMTLSLKRSDFEGNTAELAATGAIWTDGWGSGEDTGINNADIDNSTYSYFLHLKLDPNDSVSDVRFSGATIEFE